MRDDSFEDASETQESEVSTPPARGSGRGRWGGKLKVPSASKPGMDPTTSKVITRSSTAQRQAEKALMDKAQKTLDEADTGSRIERHPEMRGGADRQDAATQVEEDLAIVVEDDDCDSLASKDAGDRPVVDDAGPVLVFPNHMEKCNFPMDQFVGGML